MSLHDELRAIRLGTALHDAAHVSVLRVGGAAAFATLDRVCPCALALQDTQLRSTVWLREDGTVFADVLVGRDDERFFLLIEGPPAAEAEAWLRAHRAEGELVLEDLSRSHRLLSVHGPWAWDFLGDTVVADLVGMPYLTFVRAPDGVLAFRSGKTGEYGYELLVPEAEHAALRARLVDAGRAWGLATVSLEALDHCALENWFFNIRREGQAGLTPDELGLQWRLSRRKDFVGAAGLARRRAAGIASRLTCLQVDASSSERALQPGDLVRLEGRDLGTVLSAGFSPFLERWVAAALLELPLAVPGVTGLEVNGAAARTCSPPVLNNRSLSVSPQRHTYADRDAAEFPPLVL